MRMDSTRRQFDRSLSKEPGLKKHRLNEDPAAPDRISNGRAGMFQRPVVTNTGVGGGPRAQMDRDSESGGGAYQPQPGHQLHQELVTQYKTALSELTFNSKPIITNLTIIAGESLQAAKAIAATICANILEVPSEQKLPSLYLLDSIVKNIGRDYIKYFASRLPEVFCKAYRQVDSTIHTGMRHLFGTWKGVFPPQTLQLIEKELGFTTTPNGSSSATTSRPDSQAQRPAHSIHVNPKYLEARQRLQTTRARGAGSDNSEALVNSHEDAEALERTASISSGKSWSDPFAKRIQHHHLRDQVNEPVRDKSSNVAYSNSEYDSTISGRSGLGSVKVIEKVKEPGYDRPWYASGSDMIGMAQKKNGFGLKHGFESHAAHEPVNSESTLQLKQKIASVNSNGMSESWKNSEEEEFMWEEMTSRPTIRSSADASTKDHWAPDNYDRLDFDGHLQRSQNIPDIGSRDDDEASADSMSMDLTQVAPGTQLPVWTQKSHPAERRVISGTGKSISGYPEGYHTAKSFQSTLGKTHSLSQLGSAHMGAPSLKPSTNAMQGPNVSMGQPRQALGPISSLTRSAIHQRPPSPSLSTHNPKSQLLNNFPERNQTSTSLPTDPRRPHMQQRKHASAAHPRKLEVSELESSGQGNSSSDQSNPLTIDSPGKSITSGLFDVVGKIGIPKSTITGSLTKPISQEARLGSSPNLFSQEKLEQPPLPTGPLLPSLAAIGSAKATPNAVNSTSNPVSSLLSSLVAKGLISSSKSDSPLSTLPKIPDKPMDRVPGIAISSSTLVSSVPVTTSKPLIPLKDEPSSLEPAVIASDGLPESSPAEIKNIIGFEFRPNVVRNLNPDVISDLLSDVPHQCSICGLRLKLQERLERHMEWHASRVLEDNNSSGEISRSWYTNLVDWVARIDPSEMSGCLDDTLECIDEPMVPADESQCACILCGELFEDFYSRERDEWMFKGAVYLTNPSSESRERNESTSDTALLSPIVHANCLSEDSVRDLGMVCDVKLEKDA